MDREIAIPAWAADWTARTHTGLYYESAFTFAVLSASAIVLGLQALIHLQRCRKDMDVDPSSRAAIFLACDKRMRSITKSQLFIAVAFMSHAFILYSVDTAIGVMAVWDDASKHTDTYTSGLAARLVFLGLGMAGVFFAVCIIIPLVQILFFGTVLAKCHQGPNPENMLATYIPEARILTTHLGQFWSILSFCLMAYWPTFEYTTIRLLVAEAAFASGTVWLCLSYNIIFNEDIVAEINTRDLIEDGSHPAAYLGKQTILSLSGRTAGNSLPKHEAAKPGSRDWNEKQGL